MALAAVLALAPAAARANAPSEVCLALASRIEQAERIPDGLVQAVALAESGRWWADRSRSLPWPWTVASGTDSFYLPDKPSAIAKVRALKAEGRTNIDVGCMQINLHYHPAAFANLDEAFDPNANVTYGAGFLKQLQAETRSWSMATARYHSADPSRGYAYRERVYRLWDGLRTGGPPPVVEEPLWAMAERRLPVIIGGPSAAGSGSIWFQGGRPAVRTRPGGIPIVRGR